MSLLNCKKNNTFQGFDAVGGASQGGQMAERLGNRAINQKVAGLIPGHVKMTMCPWARHFNLFASGGMSLCYCKSLWIRVFVNVNVAGIKCKHILN